MTLGTISSQKIEHARKKIRKQKKDSKPKINCNDKQTTLKDFGLRWGKKCATKL